MKKQKWSVGFALCFLCALCLLVTVGTVKGEGTGAAAPAVPTGYLENILFEKITGKERVTIMASRQADVQVEKLAGKSIAVKMDNMFVPTDLRKSLGEGALNNVIRAVPEQSSTLGKQTVSIVIELRESVPYGYRQEGNLIIVDFNVAAIIPTAASASPPVQVAGTSTKPAQVTGSSALPAMVSGGVLDSKQPEPASELTNIKERETGSKHTITFQEATIKESLAVLAGLQPSVSIISTDDVDLKGKVTLELRDVTWSKAFETILKLKGLGVAQRDGQIIIVSTLKKISDDEDEMAKRTKTIQDREEAKKIADNKALLEKGKLKQLMIEAKILEVNDTFVRTLGVQWGAGVSTSLGGADQEGNRNYSVGLLGGTSALGTPLTKLTTGVALTRDSLAMSLGGLPLSPTLGIVLGGSNAVLNARIAAAETNATGRVLSSPRVLTQDTQKAIISQGEKIPIIMPATSTNPSSTSYTDVELKLTVTPEIKPDDHVLLTIVAENNRPNRAEKDINGNYPFFTAKVDSKVVVRDGDTVVIGGILKTDDTKGTSGVPWLSQIPIIGWLFKVEEINKTRRELLIFVTPRILKSAEDAAHTRM